MLQHLHSCGTEGRQFGKYPLGLDRLFINTVLQGLCVGKVFTEIELPASQTWAPKIRWLWLYLLTYLWDFLQVWSARKDKAAALNKGLSSLQSLAPEQRREETFSLGAGGHRMAPKPCADLLSSLFIGGRAASPCTGQELLLRSCLGSTINPCQKGPEGTRGVCVTAQVQSVVSMSLPLSLRDTCTGFTSFISFLFYLVGWI